MRGGIVLLLGLFAIGCFAPFRWPDDRRAESPVPDSIATPPSDDALMKAAECLDRGDENAALPYLQSHVKANPNALMVRAHMAELLFRLGKALEARAQFERFIADAQPTSGQAHKHLVHCHTRLMEIASTTNDDFHENLHRGIGLLLLVKRWDGDAERHEETTSEQTLSKALTALRAAHDDRPTDPRVNLYLAEVYTRLQQPDAAKAARKTAQSGLPDPCVTASERLRILNDRD